MKILLVTAALATALIGIAPAVAKSKCTPRHAAILNLNKLFGEHLSATGLTQDGKALMELYLSSENTWTILMTRTDGVSCVVASGNDWKDELPQDMASR